LALTIYLWRKSMADRSALDAAIDQLTQAYQTEKAAGAAKDAQIAALSSQRDQLAAQLAAAAAPADFSAEVAKIAAVLPPAAPAPGA
jgi:cell division protein FtsB